MGVITKLADAFNFAPPKIVEVSDVPELYADIATVHDFDETVRIFLCRQMRAEAQEAQLTALVVMPKGGFMRSLGWAATQFMRGKH